MPGDSTRWMADQQLRRFLARCTVPLVYDDEEHGRILGTGALFDFGDTPCFVTAAHVLRNADYERIGIPVAPEAEPVLEVRHDPARLVPLQHWEIWKVGEARQCVPPADDMDVAALALESAEVLQALRRTWIFLSLSHLISPYREVAEYVVAGYPDEAPVDIGDQRTFPLRVFITRRIPPPSNVAWETPPNVDIDLFLEYAETGTDSSGEEVRTPPLRGVSGAVVWAVLPSQGTPVVWTPTGPTIPRMRVAAIQSSYSHRSFIRAKKLNVLEPVIRALDTQAASRIGGVLRGGPL